jgi:hypothetical protein
MALPYRERSRRTLTFFAHFLFPLDNAARNSELQRLLDSLFPLEQEQLLIYLNAIALVGSRVTNHINEKINQMKSLFDSSLRIPLTGFARKVVPVGI